MALARGVRVLSDTGLHKEGRQAARRRALWALCDIEGSSTRPPLMPALGGKPTFQPQPLAWPYRCETALNASPRIMENWSVTSLRVETGHFEADMEQAAHGRALITEWTMPRKNCVRSLGKLAHCRARSPIENGPTRCMHWRDFMNNRRKN